MCACIHRTHIHIYSVEHAWCMVKNSIRVWESCLNKFMHKHIHCFLLQCYEMCSIVLEKEEERRKRNDRWLWQKILRLSPCARPILCGVCKMSVEIAHTHTHTRSQNCTIVCARMGCNTLRLILFLLISTMESSVEHRCPNNIHQCTAAEASKSANRNRNSISQHQTTSTTMNWMQALKHTEKFDEMKLEERNNSRMINQQHTACRKYTIL